MPALIIPSRVPDNMGAMPSVSHGPFEIEPDGRLRTLRPPRLRFAWRGRVVEAELEEGGVALSALAGALPYTAEDPGARPVAAAAVALLPAELPAGWRLRVTAEHRLRLEAVMPLPGGTTAVLLVTAMAGFAIALDPYLDRLDSAGVVAG